MGNFADDLKKFVKEETDTLKNITHMSKELDEFCGMIYGLHTGDGNPSHPVRAGYIKKEDSMLQKNMRWAF